MRKMSKLTPKLIVGMAALAIFASSADAGQRIYRKRLGFFESLFGGIQRDQQNPPLVFYDNQSAKLTWWEQQQLDQQRRAARTANFGLLSPRLTKKAILLQQMQTAQADQSEPDPLPGLGMGNVNYVPPLLVPVYDSAFLKLTTDSQAAETIRIELINKATKIRAVDSERKAVLAFYGSNAFKPVWTKESHITPRAQTMLKLMANAEDDGLTASNYLPNGLTSFDQADEAIVGDNVKVARFDIAMTVAALKYARHISGGQFDPNRLSLYNDIKPQTVAADEAVKVLAYSPFPEAYIEVLKPKHPQYAVFKKALTNNIDVSEQIASGPDLQPGMRDDRVPAIRAKLQSLGVTLAAAEDGVDPQIFDKTLSNSLRGFQKANKIKVTGLFDATTIKIMNQDRSGADRQRIIFNMERLRWLPKNLGTRYVFVNQPAYEVNVFDQNKVAWHSKVIVGKPMNQTYSFYDQIETVVFNPSWGVPASIIINEYGPKSRRDPSYLDRNGFKLVDTQGEEISSRDVNWNALGQYPKFGVQQPPGSGNALGELKFLFPNSHDIYMHDTPTKNLFADSNRAYSHGCVRVQNPREFAAVLLDMSQEEVANNLGQVVQQKGKKGKAKPVVEAFAESHSVNLSQKVPVYLTYFTAWADDTGKIQFYDDIYGRDLAMSKAMNRDPLAKKVNDSVEILADRGITGGITQN